MELAGWLRIIASWLFVIFVLIDIWISSKPSAETSRILPVVMILFIVMWSFIAVVRIYAQIWRGFGRQVVEVSKQYIRSDGILWSLRLSKDFSADHLRDLRVAPVTKTENHGMWPLLYLLGPKMLTNSMGWLAFDYGARTIRFGSGVDEAEAKQILAEILQKFPQYRSIAAQ